MKPLLQGRRGVGKGPDMRGMRHGAGFDFGHEGSQGSTMNHDDLTCLGLGRTKRPCTGREKEVCAVGGAGWLRSDDQQGLPRVGDVPCLFPQLTLGRGERRLVHVDDPSRQFQAGTAQSMPVLLNQDDVVVCRAMPGDRDDAGPVGRAKHMELIDDRTVGKLDAFLADG
jgi:hypothetical protein